MCLHSGQGECLALLQHLTPQASDLPVAYLCGQADHCRLVGDVAAHQQAKANVERFYPVVGVLEDLGELAACP